MKGSLRSCTVKLSTVQEFNSCSLPIKKKGISKQFFNERLALSDFYFSTLDALVLSKVLFIKSLKKRVIHTHQC